MSYTNLLYHIVYATKERALITTVLRPRLHEYLGGTVRGLGDKQLARGSGLFVPKEGIACNHHFLLPEDGTKFKLQAGEYILRLYAKQADRAAARLLMSVQLRITDEQAHELLDADAGIYFDWEPSQQAYLSLIENRSSERLRQFLDDLHVQ